MKWMIVYSEDDFARAQGDPCLGIVEGPDNEHEAIQLALKQLVIPYVSGLKAVKVEE